MALKRKVGLMILSFCLIYMASGSAKVQAQESKYHALFIYNFIKYIEWPQGSTNLKIGIMGNKSVNDELQKVLSARGEGKVSIVNSADISEMATCNLIFMPSKQDKNFNSVLKSIAGKKVLLVTESKGLAGKGAGISFYVENGKLKFLLNKSTIDSRNLKVSGNLMKLANVI